MHYSSHNPFFVSYSRRSSKHPLPDRQYLEVIVRYQLRGAGTTMSCTLPQRIGHKTQSGITPRCVKGSRLQSGAPVYSRLLRIYSFRKMHLAQRIHLRTNHRSSIPPPVRLLFWGWEVRGRRVSDGRYNTTACMSQ